MAAADAVEAARLGVAPSVVEKARGDMVLGTHWLRDERGKVSFTPEGRVHLDQVLGLAKKEGAAPEVAEVAPATGCLAFTIWMLEEKERGGTPQAEPGLVIVRIHSNVNYVRVRTPGNELVDVRVRDNRSLRVRLKLRCRPLLDGRWECRHTGQNCPPKPLPKKERAPLG